MPLRAGHKCTVMVALLASAGLSGSQGRADEPMPSVRINGLLLEITRLSGADLARRVAAVEADWRAHGDAVLPWQAHGPWRLLAHRGGRWNEVLQVRDDTISAEAYLSRLDVQRVPMPVPQLVLPTGCRPRSTVESTARGDAVIQVTGYCSPQTTAQLRDWAAGMAGSGWQGGLQAGGRVYRFRQGAKELTALFDLPRNEGRAGLRGFTVLQRQPAKGEP